MIVVMPDRRISPTVVGRRRELGAIATRLDEAIAGRSIHMVVAGEAGIGKSRLVDDAADAAAERGLRVLRGACPAAGTGGIPYGPLIEALRSAARTLEPDVLAAAIGPARRDLARLVPAFGDPGAADPEALEARSQSGRVLEALLGFFERLSEHGPVLLVIEDLHWADPATREAVAFLVGNVRTQAMVLVVTVRTDDLTRGHPLLPWLRESERAGRLDRLELTRLDRDGTMRMLVGILGDDATVALADRVHERSDGNPFFIEELAIAGAGGRGMGALPPTLREILLARIAATSPAAQAVIGVAAVAGRRVDHELLADVARLDEAALLGGLRTAVEGRLLVADTEPGRPEGYAFRHALVQEAAYGDLLPSERRRLHIAFAEALERRSVADAPSEAGYWSELAYHWSAARVEDRAFEASVHAGDAAERTFAFDDARRHLERVIEMWPTIDDPERRSGLDRAAVLARAAQAAWLAGDARRGVAWMREAVAEVDPSRDPTRAARLQAQLVRALWTAGDSPAALRATAVAVEISAKDPHTAERAEVLARHAQLLMLVDRCRESRALAEEAIEIAREVGARAIEGHALNTLGLDLAAEGRGDEAVAALREALAIAYEVADADDIGRAYVNLAEALVRSGRLEEAADAAEAGMAAARLVGIATTYGAFIRADAVQIAFELGRMEEARRLMADRFGNDTTALQAHRYDLARHVGLLVATGDPTADATVGELREHLASIPLESQFHGALWIAEAEALSWAGRSAEALELVQAGLEALEGNEWTWCRIRLGRIGVGVAADVAAVARARRDAAAADRAVEAGETIVVATLPLLSDADQRTEVPLAAEHAAERATIEAERGRMAERGSADAWRTAADRWSAIGRPYLEAIARYREGEAHLEAGDRTGASVALGAASALASRMGTQPLEASITALARRARIDLARGSSADPGDSAPEATPDPFGLTRREREVLALVAAGRTNRQIATELFVSESTAGVHVSNILGKLGVTGRAEAAAVAVRLGLDAPRERTPTA